MPPDAKPRSPLSVVVTLLLAMGGLVALLEQASRSLLARQEAHGALPPASRPVAHVVNLYLVARFHVLDHWVIYLALLVLGPALALLGLKKLWAAASRWREQVSGIGFKNETYDLPRVSFSFDELVAANPHPEDQVVLGVDDGGVPIYLDDRARTMHVHCLGQTGTGKTKSVIEPLLYQDVRRGRGVLVVDGKGSQENEERLAAIAAAAGRLGEVKAFTLSPFRSCHTYNPLHMTPGGDPRAIGERVFSSFAEDMDQPYYRDQSRMFFVALVSAFAATGQRFSMQDVGAAIASPELLRHALALSSDGKARRSIEAQMNRLGRRCGETFTGLLAAVQRYDIPAVNAYDPDIVLEDEIDRGGIVGFYLPANYYKQLARYMGLCVFQHLQQVGALRQLDRSRSQRPLYVYADEFYTFAYEGFTDAVNKLRDANVSILLAHQTFSDLEKVSKEYASGIWDNTRNKIVLYQNDPDVCERLAKALGTTKGVELTVRRSVDSFLNSYSTLESSSREVDAYRCHPNRIKSLRCGQAYLAQDSEFHGVNLEQVPELPPATVPAPKLARAEGLGLHEYFVSGAPLKALP